MPRRGPSEQYVLPDPDRQALIRACSDTRDRVIVKVPMFLGLRASETVHLDVRWVSSNGDLRVPSQMVCSCAQCAKKGGNWKPKTKAGARVLGIPKIVGEDLGEFLAVSPRGLEVSRFVLHHQLKKLMQRAGIVIPGLGGNSGFPHILRATCATMLAEGGMNAVQLCYTMGWTNLQIGAHYVHLAAMRTAAPQSAKEIFGG